MLATPTTLSIQFYLSKTQNSSALDAVKTSKKKKNETNGEQPVLLPSSASEKKDAVSTNVAQALFLSDLLEPDVAAAWTQSSLKAMSKDSPNIQLASRHCFLLEDPPIANDPLVCDLTVFIIIT
ncbi:hypothetical protein MRB53_003972 [Persea americana]|uniref:Uncharacterized protein n=1 Tax=Persea americana TaxID=3435 RepID=A0ACC2MZ90_PERAE|nr:hypothetical protein MRB53_003972 [Persea americana]